MKLVHMTVNGTPVQKTMDPIKVKVFQDKGRGHHPCHPPRAGEGRRQLKPATAKEHASKHWLNSHHHWKLDAAMIKQNLHETTPLHRPRRDCFGLILVLVRSRKVAHRRPKNMSPKVAHLVNHKGTESRKPHGTQDVKPVNPELEQVRKQNQEKKKKKRSQTKLTTAK